MIFCDVRRLSISRQFAFLVVRYSFSYTHYIDFRKLVPAEIQTPASVVCRRYDGGRRSTFARHKLPKIYSTRMPVIGLLHFRQSVPFVCEALSRVYMACYPPIRRWRTGGKLHLLFYSSHFIMFLITNLP